MGAWTDLLPVNPLPALLDTDQESLSYFVQRDLMDEQVGPVEDLWELPEPARILRKQQPDGSWRYPGSNRGGFPEINYDLLQTWKNLGRLVEMYGFSRSHPAVSAAAEYVFSCQTEEGDIRGVLGTQYMPYYHGVIAEVLIRAGYQDDPRIVRGLDWLLNIRQDDGGWIVPLQAVPSRQKTREMWSAPPVPPDRSLPFSHLATGMVLRAFVCHPEYCTRKEVRTAAELLKARFFLPDKYNDRKAPLYWTKLQFPFWWNNILTALDTLSLLGYTTGDEDVQTGLDWFVSNQGENGLWRTSYEQAKRKTPSAKEREAMSWVGMAVCRVFKRFAG